MDERAGVNDSMFSLDSNEWDRIERHLRSIGDHATRHPLVQLSWPILEHRDGFAEEIERRAKLILGGSFDVVLCHHGANRFPELKVTRVSTDWGGYLVSPPFDEPTNRFEAWRQRWFPRWILRFWPVRTQHFDPAAELLEFLKENPSGS